MTTEEPHAAHYKPHETMLPTFYMKKKTNVFVGKISQIVKFNMDQHLMFYDTHFYFNNLYTLQTIDQFLRKA